MKSSQDSDIVESSQEPSTNSKLEKLDKCFIKIKKVEVVQVTKTIVDEVQVEKESPEPKVIEATPIDLEETMSSIIPTSVEPENPAAVLHESKKVENIPGKDYKHHLSIKK